jgi:hypothetical protein
MTTLLHPQAAHQLRTVTYSATSIVSIPTGFPLLPNVGTYLLKFLDLLISTLNFVLLSMSMPIHNGPIYKGRLPRQVSASSIQIYKFVLTYRSRVLVGLCNHRMTIIDICCLPIESLSTPGAGRGLDLTKAPWFLKGEDYNVSTGVRSDTLRKKS